jgi:hypothetical protein
MGAAVRAKVFRATSTVTRAEPRCPLSGTPTPSHRRSVTEHGRDCLPT